MTIESPAAALTLDNARGAAWYADQTVSGVISTTRRATGARVAFAAVMALLSLSIAPLIYALAWFTFMAIWELWLRPFLEDKLVLPAARRSQQRGFAVLAAIHVVGATAYSFYPAITWSSGAPIGMVLATAWVCGSANHLFVYFLGNRLVLAACVIPLVVLSITAPFLTAGFDALSTTSAAALVALIAAACLFGFDRRALLTNMAKLAAARTAAEQENARKSQFMATMSHELRTPLNAVIGYAELIEEESQGDVATDAGKIRVSARQLLGIIDVILDLSKLESGAVALQREHGDAAAVLEQLRAAAAPLAAANNNVLTIFETSPLGDAEIDHMRLYQCLLQLISNAAKFTKDGAIQVRASRETGARGDRLVFEVADTGIGIADDQQTRIFEPFVQVDAEAGRRYEGAGLGLTLVRRLARLMGGDVTCESALGRGSAFRLWIQA